MAGCRPPYSKPLIVDLDDPDGLYASGLCNPTGSGDTGRCQSGTNAGGNCNPTGNTAIGNCNTGNGAFSRCRPGNTAVDCRSGSTGM